MPCPKRCPNGTTCDKEAGRCVDKTIGQIVVQKTLKRYPNSRVNANSKIAKETAQKLDELSDPVKKQSAIAWFKQRMNEGSFVLATLYQYKWLVLYALFVLDYHTSGRLARYWGRLKGHVVTLPWRIKDEEIKQIVEEHPTLQTGSKILRAGIIFFRDLSAANRRHTWKDASLKSRIDTLKYKVNHGVEGSKSALDVIIKYLEDENIMCSNPGDGNVAIDTLLKIVETAIKGTSNPKKLPMYEGYMAKILKIASGKSGECRS
jgi:hypothetical protein